MRSNPVSRLLLPLLVALTCGAPLATQDDKWAAKEQEISESATKRLLTYARLAERNKVFSRAKEAYELVLERYDPENAQARKALGWVKSGGTWKEPEVAKAWPDQANDERRFEVLGEWKGFAEGIAALHRDLGIEMLGTAAARGREHLLTALYYNPFDVKAHEALGHERLELGDANLQTFWGTPEEVAFVQRMREIEQFGAQLARKDDYTIEPVTELPPELQRMVDEDADIEFHGAKSDTFTVFCRGTQENADDCVKWAERACDFFEYLLPEKDKKKLDIRKTIKAQRGWIGYVWTVAEQKAFIRLNPQLGGTMNFANVAWGENGKIVEIRRALTPVSMHDGLIARVFRTLGGNEATIEGLMHAATWYLRGTAITRYGAEDPSKTVTGAEAETLPDSASWWMRSMRDQAIGRTDFPLNNVPRVQLANFRNEARTKTWSFSVWLLARYPQQWLEYLRAMPESEARPFPEKVDGIVAEVLGRPRAEIEEEWRGWAAGRTLTAYATGYGPPLLPEKPNRDQLKGLERLNEIRALIGLPPCEIDLEATLACRDHALFLQQNEDHWKWPEAHEEDPGKPGFTIRGMRAGLRSVIVIASDPSGNIDPADSLDGWVGTPYHRFPLLEPNIRRIGFAAEGSVVVLDMGSLEEPKTASVDEKFRWVPWPADGMENVPTNFHAYESPDPLGDTPEGKQQKREGELQVTSGYPISLQLADFVVHQVEDASITLYETKKRGQTFETGDVVPMWEHSPLKPLLKRQENTGVVFGIPKQPLEKNTMYEVVVTLKVAAGEQKIRWRFKTGSQRTGNGRLKIDDELKVGEQRG